MKPLANPASSHPSAPRYFFRLALLAACLLALLAAPSLHAATYYWDNNGSTSGFGDAGGTWAAPTTNNSTLGWTTDSAGTSVLSGTTTTTTSDGLNFGTAANQLGTGTITVSGNVSASTITIVGSSSNITLSGGNITLNAGLTATNSANTTAITETISSNITLGGSQTWTVNNGGTVGTQNLAVSGNVLGGANGLTKSGNSTLTLSGAANSWNGTTTVSAGTLTLSGNLSATGTIGVTSTTVGVLNITGNLTQTRTANVRNFVIAGSANSNGTVNVSGSGILNATGMYLGEDGGGNAVLNQSGGTVTSTGEILMGGKTSALNVSGGVFNIGSQQLSLGAGSLAGGSNSTLTVNGTGSITMGNLRIGAFSRNATALTVNLGDGTAGGNLSISGISYNAGAGSGPTTINFNGGTLNVRTTATMITQAKTVVKSGGAILDVNSGQTFTISNNLTTDGTGGGLTKNGTGTLTLSGAGNNYTGTTTVNAGTLTLGANQNLGAIAGAGALNLSSYTLTTNASSDTTYSGVISGTGSLTKNGTGTLTLSNAGNSYTGTTTVNAGTLALGANQSRGAIAGAGALDLSSYTLTTNSSSSTTYSGVISGTGGGLTKNGTGTLTLTNTNTYSGATTINAGTLQIDGNIANSGLVINSGATISPGTTAAADSFGTSSITINGGSYNWTLNTANGSAGSGWDQITSTAALTSSGLMTVYAYGTPGDWNNAANYSWDIFSAATLSGGFDSTNFVLDFTNFGIAVGNRTGTWSFSNPSGGIIRLSYEASGDPVWTGGTANWDTGFSPAVTEGDTIAFSGAGGTATNNISNSTLTTVNDIQFRNGAGAYTLAANAGSAGAIGGMALTVNGSIINNSLNTQTINMDVAPGSIVINTGALEIGAAGSLNSGSYSNTISNSVSLIYSGTNAQTLSGDISGAGALTKNAASTLTLTGNNTYLGATTINAGTLVIDGTGRLGGGSYAGNIVMTGAFTYNSTADQTLSGQISGAGTLFKFASSTLTLSGSNNRSGTLSMGSNSPSLTAGTVKLGHNNAVGTGGIEWENDGTLELAANGLTISNVNLIFNRNSATDGKRRYRLDLAGSNTGTFSGSFDVRHVGLVFDVGVDDTLTASNSFSNGAGGGGFEKTGAGTLVLTGATNTLNGNIVISAGTLQIGNGGTSGTLNSLAVTNNGALVFNRSNALTVSNAISGSGNVIKNASNTLTLTGSNTYSGGTTLNTGTLVIGNAAAAGTGTITQSNGSSLLKLDTTGAIASAMSIYNVSANKTVTLSGGIMVNNAVFDVASGETLTISNTINGTGGVTKNGTGTLVLSGNNTYSGATTINAGTLNAANANALGSNNTVTVNDGTLLVSTDDAINGRQITLNGTSTTVATLAFSNNYTGSIGKLTLSANSIIDLGQGNIGLQFADMAMGFYNLSIYNWSGTTQWGTTYGTGTDRLYFNGNYTASNVKFYSGAVGSDSFVGSGFDLGLQQTSWDSGLSGHYILPVPEPETYATGLLLLLGGAWMWRKRSVFTTQLDLEGDAPSAPQEDRASAPIDKW
jgi:fibronectin-binding autotransporter adhesin